MAKSTAPELNIGLVGHVDHGKTTLTEKLSGKWTDTHSEELKRGITIRLGYADTSFVKTKKGEYTTEEAAKKSKQDYKILRKVSFVDAPGHESLMATMLAGATLMDGALLLIAANEECPHPRIRLLFRRTSRLDLRRTSAALASHQAPTPGCHRPSA